MKGTVTLMMFFLDDGDTLFTILWDQHREGVIYGKV